MCRGMSSHAGNRDLPAPRRAVVLVLVLGVQERARVRTALRSRYDVRFVDRTVDLAQQALGTREPLAGIIVGTHDLDGRSTVDVVRLLREAAVVPLIAYCAAGTERSGEIQALIVAGVHELLYDGVDAAAVTLRAVLESAQRAQVGERAAAALMARLPERLWAFVKLATSHPEMHRVSELADALGYNRKTLVNHCTGVGFPPPHELLAWCRLTVVGELLTSTTRTIESIALQLDFASDTALRNMIKRYTGLRASDVRVRGGMQCILDAFDAAMRARRAVAEAAS